MARSVPHEQLPPGSQLLAIIRDLSMNKPGGFWPGEETLPGVSISCPQFPILTSRSTTGFCSMAAVLGIARQGSCKCFPSPATLSKQISGRSDLNPGLG